MKHIFRITFFIFHFSFFISAPFASGDGADFDIFAELHSQHLDEPRRSPYTYSATYSPKTEFGSFGTTDIGEFTADFRILDFDYDFCRFDFWAFAHATAFFENPGMSSLPDALLETGADIGFNVRFDNGWSWEIRAAPGVYSDVVSPAFGLPLTLNSYFAVDPELSFQIGATYRHDWGNPLMLNLGLAWQPVEEIRIEAGIPKSRVTLFNNYRISPFAAFEWRNITYSMSGKDGTPKSLTFEDMTLTAGLAVSPLNTWTLTGEIGTYIHRHISAPVAENATVEMSKEPFFRFALKSEF